MANGKEAVSRDRRSAPIWQRQKSSLLCRHRRDPGNSTEPVELNAADGRAERSPESSEFVRGGWVGRGQ